MLFFGRKTVASVMSKFQRVMNDLRALEEYHQKEAARHAQSVLEAQAAHDAAIREAAAARDSAVKIGEMLRPVFQEVEIGVTSLRNALEDEFKSVDFSVCGVAEAIAADVTPAPAANDAQSERVAA